MTYKAKDANKSIIFSRRAELRVGILLILLALNVLYSLLQIANLTFKIPLPNKQRKAMNEIIKKRGGKDILRLEINKYFKDIYKKVVYLIAWFVNAILAAITVTCLLNGSLNFRILFLVFVFSIPITLMIISMIVLTRSAEKEYLNLLGD